MMRLSNGLRIIKKQNNKNKDVLKINSRKYIPSLPGIFMYTGYFLPLTGVF